MRVLSPRRRRASNAARRCRDHVPPARRRGRNHARNRPAAHADRRRSEARNGSNAGTGEGRGRAAGHLRQWQLLGRGEAVVWETATACESPRSSRPIDGEPIVRRLAVGVMALALFAMTLTAICVAPTSALRAETPDAPAAGRRCRCDNQQAASARRRHRLYGAAVEALAIAAAAGCGVLDPEEARDPSCGPARTLSFASWDARAWASAASCCSSSWATSACSSA